MARRKYNKKRYNKKKNYGKKKYKLKIHRRIPKQVFPNAIYTKLKYVEQFGASSSILEGHHGEPVWVQYTMNDINTPGGIMGTNIADNKMQPNRRDNYFALYDKVFVYAAKLTMIFTPISRDSSAANGCVHLITTSTDSDPVIETHYDVSTFNAIVGAQTRNVYCEVPGIELGERIGKPVKMKVYRKTKYFQGDAKDQSPWSHVATEGWHPAKKWFAQLGVSSVTNFPNFLPFSGQMQVYITYYCKFYDLRYLRDDLGIHGRPILIEDPVQSPPDDDFEEFIKQ